MSGIRWSQAMGIDQGLIDDDHRHLIDIINRFGHYFERGQARVNDAVDVLYALDFYAQTHFEREERLQRLVEYPESQAHRREHERLQAELTAMIAGASSAREDVAAEIVADLGQLLRKWLLNHVIQHDLRMKPYAPLMKRHAARLPELRGLPAITFAPPR